MKTLAAFLAGLFLAAPSAGQPVVVAPSPSQPAWTPYQSMWNPIADYVEPGQDEPGYRQWIAYQPWRAGAVGQFHQYLTASGVAFVAPTWQLLRTASDWRKCGAEPFEIPPVEEWPNIVNTLRYVRDHVVPRVGPVEPVSVFRNATLNRCAGGAPESVHRSMSAIDFVPLSPIDRNSMIRRLCAEHQQVGPRYNAGLGFYTKMRFHVDSWKYRTWGRDDGGHIACPKVAPPPPPVLESTPVTTGATIAHTNTGAVSDNASIARRQAEAMTPPATTSALPAKDPLAPL